MRIRQWFAIACGVVLVAGVADAAGQAAAASSGLDGLIEIKSKYFDQAYLRPGSDFRGYTKVMLSPTEVTFAKSWLPEMNRNPIAVLQGTTVADADRIAKDVRLSLRNVFSGVFRNAGYEIVATPGPDVLRLSLRVVDLYISAPRTVTQALPSRVYTYDAGRAALVLDIHDATTDALLGRFVDRRTAGYRGSPASGVRITTTVTNQFDFESLFGLWASNCIEDLKAQSPVAMNLPTQKKF